MSLARSFRSASVCCVGELCLVTTLRGVRGSNGVPKEDAIPCKFDIRARYGVERGLPAAALCCVDSKERSSSSTSTGSIQPEVLMEAFLQLAFNNRSTFFGREFTSRHGLVQTVVLQLGG